MIHGRWFTWAELERYPEDRSMNDELLRQTMLRLANSPASTATLREWLSGCAMAGLLNWRDRRDDTPEKIAGLAVAHADCLLRELARTRPEGVSPGTVDSDEDFHELTNEGPRAGVRHDQPLEGWEPADSM